MRRILQPVRCITILVTMFTFLFHMCLVWLVVRNRWSRVRWSNRILTYYARWGLWVMKVRPHIIGEENLLKGEAGLYVGNHLSYMDVLVISSRISCGFVTSMEIKETPVLGQICTMAGCLFVERRTKTNLHKEVADLREGLSEGVNVAIFPEATSTNGEQILRFRRPLYLAAIDARRPVIPFCLNYRLVGGEPINRVTRDSICWYGDMDFLPHLWALAGSGGVDVDLIFLPPIIPVEDDDPTRLAAESQAAVESVFAPIR